MPTRARSSIGQKGIRITTMEDTAEAKGEGSEVDVDEGQRRAEEVGALLVGGEDEGRQVRLEEGDKGG